MFDRPANGRERMRQLGFDAADIPGEFLLYKKCVWFFVARRGQMAEIHFTAEPGGAKCIKPGLLSTIELCKDRGFVGVLGIVGKNKRSVNKLCRSIGLNYLDTIEVKRLDNGRQEAAEVYYREF